MTNSLRGRVIAITGGARGIGFATATALTQLGAKVAIGDIDDVKLKESATELDLLSYSKLDVTDTESFEAFLDDVEAKLGPIDVLVNNAGIMPAGRIVDEPDAVTRRILDINVLGVITGSKLAARRMLPRGRGHVINIASLAGEIYTPGLATYCASKYAVVGFTDAARVEHRGTGIEFSAVLPSFVNTELTAGTKGIPGLKNAEPEDIARAIVSLIENPKPKVRVTKLVGALAASQKFFPRRIGEALNRALHTDKVFLDDVDITARQAYEERARHS
ncbi:SDR family oxidoreductase [Rhodococcus sp. H36-A4]|uniref:SDR family oxidoreductase n=1 Tax=unclassified Rhodococcus (in: high G+C Gram-positive bacteria) TaxID=192944 RepID=UPI00109DFF30|nr:MULTISPECIES: SDR family oxidoreductase [unclassified Rhodococcus (in: high G+C Gram-positive bacteria)]MCZ4077276.1 SDR family oxidoreductase [Rhodococcus sp. H36-A4]QCB49661.1 SDR family oxidoreductase [Rhodococcus sp. PAMC28705]QCB58648.1 SDR family oxidoreductase [Rhodococcus sp. PAMC28707]